MPQWQWQRCPLKKTSNINVGLLTSILRGGSPLLPSHQNVAQQLVFCRKNKDQLHALYLYTHMRRNGLHAHPSFGNQLVCILVLVGALHHAHHVFDSICFPDQKSWDTIITGHAHSGNVYDAFALYRKMLQCRSLSPSGFTSVALAQSCSKSRDLDLGNRLHRCIAEASSIQLDVFIGSALIDMYARCGSLLQAERVFDSLPDRNVVSWNAFMNGCLEYGCSDQVLILFEQMQVEVVSPNSITLVCVLRACSDIGVLHIGEEIHAEIERLAMIPSNAFVSTTLVDMYCKCGAMSKAQEIFDSLVVRDIVSWTALIAGYADSGHGMEALECFEKMQMDGIYLNAFTILSCLKACRDIRDVKGGQDIHLYIEKMGLLTNNAIVGSMLVDMYGKCGLLPEAEKVFDKVPFKDSVTWTSLIAGYAEHGYADKAFVYFEEMNNQRISADGSTFTCIVRACANMCSIVHGISVHAEIERKGLLGEDPYIGNNLVLMYTRCGCLVKAKETFDTLLNRDVISWNTLISGYVEQNCGDDALECFDGVLIEGVNPDDTTYICALKACGITEAIRKGEEIHAEIERKGLKPFVGTTLTDMYAKFGLGNKSEEVFDRLLIRDTASWNAIISGYMKIGHGQDALKHYSRMKLEDVFPDDITVIYTLKACGDIGSIEKGLEIHAMVKESGLVGASTSVSGALVDMYFLCGFVVKAQHAFEDIPFHDTIMWNIWVEGLLNHGLSEEALNCLDQMQIEGVFPDAATYISGLKACRTTRTMHKGAEKYAEVEKKGLVNIDVNVGHAVVDMYAGCGSLEEAEHVFNQLPVKDIISWNALMQAFVEYGHAEKTFMCFEQMQNGKIIPDAMTYVCMLKACSILGDVDKGFQIHSEIEMKALLETNFILCSTLVDIYAKCDVMDMAQHVFDQVPYKDVVMWNTLMTGYGNLEHGAEVLKCRNYMQLQHISPNDVTYLCCLKACGDIGAIENGWELHSEIVMKGMVDENCFVGNALVDMYAKFGLTGEAEQLFGKLSVQDIVSWNSLIAGQAQLGRADKVFFMFEQMLEAGMRPDAVTFVVLLTTCSHAGLVKKGDMYFQAMAKDYGIAPNMEHYSCVLDLFSRTGDIEKAMTIVRKMPDCSNPVVWHTLLSASKNSGAAKIGKMAFTHAIDVDVEDSASYVLMSQINANDDHQAC